VGRGQGDRQHGGRTLVRRQSILRRSLGSALRQIPQFVQPII
jgi:hypothetical protein